MRFHLSCFVGKQGSVLAKDAVVWLIPYIGDLGDKLTILLI